MSIGLDDAYTRSFRWEGAKGRAFRKLPGRSGTLARVTSSDATANQPEARILVVDDEPNIADLLATSLRFVGFDVRTAGTGREALATAEAYQPELLVLDVMLPDLDGFEVLRGCERAAARAGGVPHRPRRHRGQGHAG